MSEVPAYLKVIQAEQILSENAVYATEIKNQEIRRKISQSQYIYVQNKTGVAESSADENEHASIPQESSIPGSISINQRRATGNGGD